MEIGHQGHVVESEDAEGDKEEIGHEGHVAITMEVESNTNEAYQAVQVVQTGDVESDTNEAEGHVVMFMELCNPDLVAWVNTCSKMEDKALGGSLILRLAPQS
ncbi:hypothetical protein Vretimale_3921 [Volvox reticuliferus]|uniref:Uncharacterized protein n=1 Tax=Volvox reticuliferus TaxID=1737510 RepID=A0A8J4G4W1_9CHLO|nr:hypothetical protein Vretifemale_1524 [Volvox reticuliferus]GIL98566.1 hypothetical protein Vretimale_3921 [Volvox reticuliferus]